MPDISKWNAIFPEKLNISSFNSNSISIKDIKSDSIIQEDIIEYSKSMNDSYSLEDNNDNKSFEYISSTFISNNSELNEYYDHFYD